MKVEEAAGKGSSSAKDLVPKQVPAPQATAPAAPKFWAVGPSVLVARWGPPASSRTWGQVPAMQVALLPPAESDKGLA